MSLHRRLLDLRIRSRFGAAVACAAFALAGCQRQSETSAETPTEATEPQADVQPSAPTDAAKPTVTAATDLAATAPADMKPSLCAGGERVIFSCALEGSKKIASMCASADASATAGYVYYAYGAQGALELVYPKARAHSMSDFKRARLIFAGGTGGYAYSFETAAGTHAVYSISGTEGLANQGVAVFKNDFKKAYEIQQCDPGTVVESDDMDLIGLTLKWERDRRIEESGIPFD